MPTASSSRRPTSIGLRRARSTARTSKELFPSTGCGRQKCSGKPVGFRGLLQRRYRAFHVGWYGRQYRVGGFRCEGRGDLELASMDDRSAGAVRLRRGRRIDGSQSRSDQRPGSRRGASFGLLYQWGRKDPFYGGERTKIRATASSCGHGNRRSSIRLMHRWHGSPCSATSR